MSMRTPSDNDPKAGLSTSIFVGCLAIGVGVGIGFDCMPAAPVIGFGIGLIGSGIARYEARIT